MDPEHSNISKEMHSYIKEIEGVFQVDLSPDLVRVVEEAPDRKLADLSLAMREFEKSKKWQVAHKREPGELRPYFPEHFRNYKDWVVGGLGLGKETFNEIDSVWKAVDNLKLPLLYCHSLAIDDPGSFIVDVFETYYRNLEVFRRSFYRSKKRFMNYLNFLIQVQPLIDAGVLVLIPRSISSSVTESRRHIRSDSKWSDRPTRLKEQLDFSDISVIAQRETGFQDATDFHKEALITIAEENLEDMAKMSQAVAGGVDFFFPYRFWANVLRDMLDELPQMRPESHIPENQLYLLAELVSIPVPGLASLHPRDIVRLRQNEEAFDEWRKSIGRSLERINALPQGTLDYDRESLRILRDETQQGKAMLEKRISESRFLKKLRRSGKVFTIGSISALLAHFLVGELKIGIATAAGTAIAELLLDRSSTKADDTAVIQHYVALYPEA